MESLFASETLAAGYALARPAVHPRVLARVRRHLGLGARLRCAADIGCGAGLSTRPLTELAELTIGIEPVERMLRWSRQTAPAARFLAGRAEQIPLRDASVDLLTAAGSLNYADPGRFFPEAKRVLRSTGTLVVYDFSQGRTITGDPSLEAWFAAFIRRFPPPESAALRLTPDLLVPLACGFRPAGAEWYEESLLLDHEFYVNYVMTETNVAAAVRAGQNEESIRQWCRNSLEPVFGGAARPVEFRGYIACFLPV